MKLSIDIDGVLANFNAGLIRTANFIWPRRIPEDYEPPDWNYSDVFTAKELSRVWDAIKDTRNFWFHLPAYRANVAELSKYLTTAHGNDTFLVTSRVPTRGLTVAVQTREWLNAMGVEPNGYNSLAVIPVKESNWKVEVIRALGVEASVDDHAPTVRQCQVVRGHRAFLLARPWNAKEREGLHVVTDLEEFFATSAKRS